MKTADQLKAKIDAWLGMISTLRQQSDSRADITYHSPTGKSLFVLHLFSDGSGWKFSGYDNMLPDSWSYLCNIHRE